MRKNRLVCFATVFLALNLAGCKSSTGGKPVAAGSASVATSTSTAAQAGASQTNSGNRSQESTGGTSAESLPKALLDFIPFRSKVSIPQNLLGEYASLHVVQPANATVDAVDLQNHQVYMDRRIASMMSAIVQKNGVMSFPNFMECGFDADMANLAASANSKIQSAIERGSNLCFKLRQPEGFFYKGSLFVPGFFSMLELQDALEAVVTAPMMQGVPFSFFDAPTTRSVQSAMLRVKFSTLTSDFNDFFGRIDAALAVSGLSTSEKQNLSKLRASASMRWVELNAWNDSGKSAYNADAQKIVAQGKIRSVLPYNNLSDNERKNLSMYLYAMMWRFRGGGFEPLHNTQYARIFFAQLPYTMLAQLNGVNIADSIEMGANMSLTLALEGWSYWMDMGTTPNQDPEINDLINMSLRGLEQTRRNSDVVSRLGYDTQIMKFYSLQFGICYMYSFDRLKGVYIKKDVELPFSGFFDWPTAWGEHCAGAAFGLGLAETLLAGHK